MFRNVTMEFPEKPPHVPDYYNPVGSYFRTFEVPKNWDGRQIFLHFEGVKSASYGLGEWQGSRVQPGRV
jgi:beta-galactosidase